MTNLSYFQPDISVAFLYTKEIFFNLLLLLTFRLGSKSVPVKKCVIYDKNLHQIEFFLIELARLVHIFLIKREKINLA